MYSDSQKMKIMYKFLNDHILLLEGFLNVKYVILFLSTLFCKSFLNVQYILLMYVILSTFCC